MPNLHDCIQRAVDAKDLDTTRGRQIQSQYVQLRDRYAQAMPIHQAEATAAAHLKEATKAQRLSRRHKVLAQLQAQIRLKHQIETAPNPELAIRNLLEHSEGSGFTGETVASLSNAMIRSVNSGLNEVVHETGRDILGNSRNPVLLDDVIRELHLDDTGNARAKVLSGAVRHQQRRMRQQFNAHGGDIGEIADYGVSHSHDVAVIKKAGFDTWVDEVHPRLDWSRIPDTTTGKPFARAGSTPSKAKADRFLRDVYDGITTRGWDDRDPAMSIGGKALYARRAEHRVLHFKSGADWLDYNKKFGTSDPFSAMIGGLHGTARDIAQMRVLGPNPTMGLEYATQVARKRAELSGDDKLITRVRKSSQLSKTMLSHIDGSVSTTEAEGWARFFSNTRKVLTSIQLGSASLSAVTDFATIGVASDAIGMKPKNVFSNILKLVSSSATRETAARMGFVADTMADAGSTAARFTGEVMAGELAERLSNFTMRASGLSFWTDMARTGFQMEFAGFLAENAGRQFDQIDPNLRQIFQSRGITGADWDLLRDTTTHFTAPSGANFITPFHWLEHQTTLHRAEAEGLSMRLQMAIEEQMELAIPSASIEGRARLVGDTQPGTIPGEFWRSGVMYKSFALSMMLNQYRRFLSLPTPMARAKYAATLSTGLILLGGVAIQLKELAKGNDPRPMDRGEFWMAAVLQGGGLGIFGDFFAAKKSRLGGGFAQTLAGPVVGMADNIGGIALNPLHRLAQGKAPLIGRDLSNLARYNTPVASSLWYARLAFDRLVADTIQGFLDPEAETQWRRQIRRKERDYGTSAWWSKGRKLPERAPNIANIGGVN